MAGGTNADNRSFGKQTDGRNSDCLPRFFQQAIAWAARPVERKQQPNSAKGRPLALGTLKQAASPPVEACIAT